MGARILSTTDIATEMGLTRQRIGQLAKAESIPARRAPGKQWRFYESAEFATWRKERGTERRPPAKTRAQRVSQRRRERIKRLVEILDNKIEVNPAEKALALNYINVLGRLLMQKIIPIVDLPLLEGIQAVHDAKFFTLDYRGVARLEAYARLIEELPTRPRSQPHSSDAAG